MHKFLLSALLFCHLLPVLPTSILPLTPAMFQKNQRKELSWENDTVNVTYKFSGEGGLMTINVFNKTNQPLYVNWK